VRSDHRSLLKSPCSTLASSTFLPPNSATPPSSAARTPHSGPGARCERSDDEHGRHLNNLQPQRRAARSDSTCLSAEVRVGRALGRALQLGARLGLAGHGPHEEDVPTEPDGGPRPVLPNLAATWWAMLAPQEQAREVGGVGEPWVGGSGGAEPRHDLWRHPPGR
jgi:hypothetical protein